MPTKMSQFSPIVDTHRISGCRLPQQNDSDDPVHLSMVPFPSRLFVAAQVVLMTKSELDAFECSNPRELQSSDEEDEDMGWDPDINELFVDEPHKKDESPRVELETDMQSEYQNSLSDTDPAALSDGSDEWVHAIVCA